MYVAFLKPPLALLVAPHYSLGEGASCQRSPRKTTRRAGLHDHRSTRRRRKSTTENYTHEAAAAAAQPSLQITQVTIKIESPETHGRQLPNKAASPKNAQARTRDRLENGRHLKTRQRACVLPSTKAETHTHTDAEEQAKCRICLRCGTQPAVGDEERRSGGTPEEERLSHARSKQTAWPIAPCRHQ